MPTKIMAAKDASEFMHFCSRWLVAHIPEAELLWRAGGHVNANDNEEARLFAWLEHGYFPDLPQHCPTHFGTPCGSWLR